MQGSPAAESLLKNAIDAVTRGDDLYEALEALPAPIYVTDADGFVTHFNSACVGFAGRTPTVGKDRWCVTWRLYTDAGDFLPHEECPMAAAIRGRATVRGVSAVAQRPDGTRVNFLPLPTPLFDKDGRLAGAINLLIDITEARQIEDLRRQAERCRRLSAGTPDLAAAETLRQMAIEYAAKAAELAAEAGREERSLRLVEFS